MANSSYGFVYITTNVINNKKYIGQRKYSAGWESYLGSGVALKAAIKKYGRDNFIREIVYTATSEEDLNEVEYTLIAEYKAVESGEFYNLVDGGGTVTGMKHSAETKRGMSERNSGEKNYFYGKRFEGASNPFYGKTHTDETRTKMSDSHAGRSPWNKGKTGIYTEEALLRMSIAKKGIPITEEHRMNIIKSQAGLDHPMLGKSHSEETKDKIREKNSRKVICLTTLEVFESGLVASQKYGISPSNLSKCCRGKVKSSGKTSEGEKLVWSFYDDYLERISSEEESA